MATKKKVVEDGVIVHIRITRPPASDSESLAQRGKKFMDADLGLKLFHHELPKREQEVHTDTDEVQSSTVSATVDVGSIRWVRKGSQDYHMTAHCPKLMQVAQKFCSPDVNFNKFYRDLVEGLKDPKFEGVVTFYIIATGVVPKREREFGTFIKLKGEDTEFVLPNSFLKDCMSVLRDRSFSVKKV